MARLVYSPKISTRNARLKLPARKEPYWHSIAPSFAIGYYRGAKGSAWIAKWRDADTGQRFMERLSGSPDDILDADGVTVLSWEQAQKLAQQWQKVQVKKAHGDLIVEAGYSVADAVKDYLAAKELKGEKPDALAKQKSAMKTHILPTLGDTPLAKLRIKTVREWHAALATAPRKRRPGKGRQLEAPIDVKDGDAVRRRQSTANRLLTVLKAVLNHALKEQKATSAAAWAGVSPFKEADAPKIQYLNADQRTRLLNACEPDFRDLVHAALVTGCRYGELISMKAAQFEAETGVITIEKSKAGKKRNVALNDEGRALFERLTAGKRGGDFILLRADGEKWKSAQQGRRIEEASQKANIEPKATFHILRHSYASALAMQGVPMVVIASQLGHADTRMTEKHYAHLSPSHVANVIRAHLPNMGGGAEQTNVAKFRLGAGSAG